MWLKRLGAGSCGTKGQLAHWRDGDVKITEQALIGIVIFPLEKVSNFYLCPVVLLPGFARWEWVRGYWVGARGFVQAVFLFDQGVWYGRQCLV